MTAAGATVDWLGVAGALSLIGLLAGWCYGLAMSPAYWTCRRARLRCEVLLRTGAAALLGAAGICVVRVLVSAFTGLRG